MSEVSAAGLGRADDPNSELDRFIRFINENGRTLDSVASLALGNVAMPPDNSWGMMLNLTEKGYTPYTLAYIALPQNAPPDVGPAGCFVVYGKYMLPLAEEADGSVTDHEFRQMLERYHVFAQTAAALDRYRAFAIPIVDDPLALTCLDIVQTQPREDVLRSQGIYTLPLEVVEQDGKETLTLQVRSIPPATVAKILPVLGFVRPER